jgi:AAA family ATP:ADP antiporter
VVDVVGGRLGKAGGAFLQSTLLMIFGFYYHKKITLMDIAPHLFVILVLICITWLLAVRALSKKIIAVTAQQGKNE